MPEWDNIYDKEQGGFNHSLGNVEHTPSASGWQRMSSFLEVHNREIKRKRRRRMAVLFFLPFGLLSAAGTVAIVLDLQKETSDPMYFASANALLPFSNKQDRIPQPLHAVIIGSAGNHVKGLSGVTYGLQDAQQITSADLPEEPTPEGVRNDQENLPTTEAIQSFQPIANSTNHAKTVHDLILKPFNSLPASLLRPRDVDTPALTELAFPFTSPAVPSFSVHVEAYGETFSVQELTSNKTLPLETSSTLGTAMVFVPGKGITFSRPDFHRPQQTGLGAVVRFGNRFGVETRAAYYWIDSFQETDEFKGHYAIKEARLSNAHLYSGIRYYVLNTRVFKLYTGAGLGVNLGLSNRYRLLQYKDEVLINDHSEKERVRGNSGNADLSIGMSVDIWRSFGVFAEATTHRSIGSIQHLNAPSFTTNGYFSLRSGIKLTLP